MLAFRRFTDNDIAEAAGVYVSCFNAPPWNDDWSIEAARKRLETLLQFPGTTALVATYYRRIVGLATCHCEPWSDGMHFYLNEMCIEAEEQRKGVGEVLMKFLRSFERPVSPACIY